MTNLVSVLNRDITLPTKVCMVKAMVFPVVMYGCESWTINKAECQRTDAFELRCWRELFRIPWTEKRLNQFPHSSVGKESTCNAGDPASIPEPGKLTGEGIGYPLQYSGLQNFMDCIVYGVAKSWTRLSNFHFYFLLRASLVAQTVKNLPAKQIWIRSLGRENPLKKRMATHSSVLT